MFIIILIIIIVVCLIVKYHKSKYTESKHTESKHTESKHTETFYDIAPYKQHWDIFECDTPDCIRNKGYDCYKWCDNIDEGAAAENCRMRCEDYSDQTYDYLKYQNYTWRNINGQFLGYSILNDTNDYVMSKTENPLTKGLVTKDPIPIIYHKKIENLTT